MEDMGLEEVRSVQTLKTKEVKTPSMFVPGIVPRIKGGLSGTAPFEKHDITAMGGVTISIAVPGRILLDAV